VVGRFETGKHSEQCGFAAARSTEQGKERATADRDVAVLDGDHRAEVLGQVVEADVGIVVAHRSGTCT
jgi:hypothetical protein